MMAAKRKNEEGYEDSERPKENKKKTSAVGGDFARFIAEQQHVEDKR